jgi:hypothetical protein
MKTRADIIIIIIIIIIISVENVWKNKVYFPIFPRKSNIDQENKPTELGFRDGWLE